MQETVFAEIITIAITMQMIQNSLCLLLKKLYAYDLNNYIKIKKIFLKGKTVFN